MSSARSMINELISKIYNFSDKIIMHHKIFFNVLVLPTQSKQTVFKQDNLNN
jgi:hypothetical protein